MCSPGENSSRCLGQQPSTVSTCSVKDVVKASSSLAGAINAGFFLYYILQTSNAVAVKRRTLLSAAWKCLQAVAGIVAMAAAVLHVSQQGALPLFHRSLLQFMRLQPTVDQYVRLHWWLVATCMNERTETCSKSFSLCAQLKFVTLCASFPWCLPLSILVSAGVFRVC
jgi:hypothetical protein